MLEINNINTFYGKSHILHDVSLEVEPREVVAVMGRNGVGKTTLLRSIIGLTPPESGRILYHGEDIANEKPNERAEKGIGYVPQKRRMFPELSVKENLRMGAGTASSFEDRLEYVLNIFPKLKNRQDQKAGTLSGGEQQMVAIGRALMGDPELILMDEPTEGLMPSLIPQIQRVIREVVDNGRTILLVEQNVRFTIDVSDRSYVMDKGKMQVHLDADEMDRRPSVLENHLKI